MQSERPLPSPRAAHHAAARRGRPDHERACPRPRRTHRGTGLPGRTRSLGLVAAAAGVVSESEHRSLRADIRRLSTMLGRTLAHHGGPELLDLVEEVRRLSRLAPESGSAEITHLLAGLDTGTAVALTRAFSRTSSWRTPPSSCTARASCARCARFERRPLRMLMQRLAEEFPGRGARRGPGRHRAVGAAAGVHRAPDRVVAPVRAADPAARR